MDDNNKIERKSFLFYESYRDVAHKLPEKERLGFYEMLIEFGLTGKEPQGITNPLIDMAFTVIRPIINANIKNYINGCKGGAPFGNRNAKKTTQKQPKNNRKSTQKQGNDNENVNENVNNTHSHDSHSSNQSNDSASLPTLEELELAGTLRREEKGFYG